jgi:hypothetical protein
MMVIGMASTYGADRLKPANAVVDKLGQIQIAANGAGKLGVGIG